MEKMRWGSPKQSFREGTGLASEEAQFCRQTHPLGRKRRVGPCPGDLLVPFYKTAALVLGTDHDFFI